jgi:hypothetical protein
MIIILKQLNKIFIILKNSSFLYFSFHLVIKYLSTVLIYEIKAIYINDNKHEEFN